MEPETWIERARLLLLLRRPLAVHVHHGHVDGVLDVSGLVVLVRGPHVHVLVAALREQYLWCCKTAMIFVPDCGPARSLASTDPPACLADTCALFIKDTQPGQVTT